ncbi:phosphoenolpyruvate--protein phosphotransferase [Candidatus Haliotispira prima]|uniref:Phosphoenolpyruvate-protein phosphotransferase n=1 Tax=Candidatus Haliotispira prima TaxID=3034016 RepID=A0ABY8MDX0_9SPIO|nr:phosphoenolpyruvate--protein phosphotransferase [Candidatus Haliotispira prima]
MLEQKYSGIKASAGIAIGKALIYQRKEFQIPDRQIAEGDVVAEVERLSKGLKEATAQLEQVHQQALENLGKDEAEIFEGHLEILGDEDLIGEIRGKIRGELVPAEKACHDVYEANAQELAELDNEYMRERANDVRDIGKRLIHAVAGIKMVSLAGQAEQVIVIAEDLMPSDTAQMDRNKVLGFAIDKGGPTSHVAIMAQSLEIPAIVGAGNISSKIKTGDMLILDPASELVIVNPGEKSLSYYRKRLEGYRQEQVKLSGLKELSAETTDGHQVELCANIGSEKDIEGALRNGAEGVGLFRTEFLYMDRSAMPDEEEQFEAYKVIAEGFTAARPVIVRTMDIGGDKGLSYFDIPQEENPFLGWRAIRICLDMPEILRTQLRAILRASQFGKLRIMFPMVISCREIDQLIEILQEVKEELWEKHVEFDESIEVGIMIETPGAALIADKLIEKVDFFSIGTNDLTQYTLAVDRGNEKIAHLYQSFHPAVLRLIKLVIDASHKAGKWTGMCGSFAGNEEATLLLLGLGLDEFSMSAVNLPRIKRLIRGVSYAECEKLAARVLDLSYSYEVREQLKKYSSKVEL